LTLRILIVDDAAVERAVFASIALRLGHEMVGEADDAATALPLAARLAPDLIVVDGRLPSLEADTVDALRAAAPSAALAVVVAFGERDLMRTALERGATAVLRRPFLATQVEAALRDIAPSG
jgi:two-component system, chemotaxis family, chemotaxis protein CheY